MPALPHAAFDSSLAFLREGYTFVSSRCDALNSDLFATRIMLTPVICMRGAEAAEMFYEGDRFTRQGAMPRSVLYLLQDQGSVQTLDAADHRHRKAMFLSMMAPAAIDRLVAIFRKELQASVGDWQTAERVVLLHAMQSALTRAVCRWAGVPLQDAEVAPRTREFAAMVESAGSLGPKNWRAQLLRQRTERWARRRIEALRGEGAAANDGTAAEIIASHRGPDGALLDAGIAAIELLNVLRPTVAVANFITFAALALHEHRPWGERFASGNDEDLRPFSQEVRRYYPFFPVVGGRARDRFEWHGHAFEKGQWVLLDLYGTNHDARLCHEPKSFRPERFRAWNDEPNTFIPQGAGHVETGHRCPGEEITVRLVEESVRFLTRDISYFVPPQRLGYRLSQLPALPQSGFQINRVAPR